MIAEIIKYTCAVGAVAVVGVIVGANMILYERENKKAYLRKKMPPHAQEIWDRFNKDFPREGDQLIIQSHLREMYNRRSDKS